MQEPFWKKGAFIIHICKMEDLQNGCLFISHLEKSSSFYVMLIESRATPQDAASGSGEI